MDVPTPDLALDVQRAGIPGAPGAMLELDMNRQGVEVINPMYYKTLSSPLLIILFPTQ